jgi:predicted DNA-binding transcriptional regulator AlpA
MGTIVKEIERLLTEHEVAGILHVSVATVRRRRQFGQPPHPIKIGSSVRYTAESVAALIAESRTKPDAEGEAR